MLENILTIIKEIQSKQKNSFVAVGIDGGGASGKSALATQIAHPLPETQIIHMDDFYKPSKYRKITKLENAPLGYEYDIDRLIEQVITPLLSKKTAFFQKYDWENDRLDNPSQVTPSGVILIEGCYSTIDYLNTFYHLKIFVDCKRAVRLERGLERDGEAALPNWLNWMDGEDKYFAEQHTKENADIVFIGETAL